VEVTQYNLRIPDNFLEYEWEVIAKGWFADVLVNVAEKNYKLQFYDSIRLAQEVTDALAENSFFYGVNVVVVSVVDLRNIQDAVKSIVEEGLIYSMLVEL
jgi:hypothetical protein